MSSVFLYVKKFREDSDYVGSTFNIFKQKPVLIKVHKLPFFLNFATEKIP